MSHYRVEIFTFCNSIIGILEDIILVEDLRIQDYN